MWDQRYDQAEYLYGKEANDWLIQNIEQLSPGHALCLAAGEGRNAVYLAQKGFDVQAVDSSGVGLRKAVQLANEKHVSIQTEVIDLREFSFSTEKWDLITSFFCHLPPLLRKSVHKSLIDSLKPGGYFILEAFSPLQLQYKTGGPSVKELLMDLQEILEELAGLHFIQAQENIRPISEGILHQGESAVIQILAQKSPQFLI